MFMKLMCITTYVYCVSLKGFDWISYSELVLTVLLFAFSRYESNDLYAIFLYCPLHCQGVKCNKQTHLHIHDNNKHIQITSHNKSSKFIGIINRYIFKVKRKKSTR